MFTIVNVKMFTFVIKVKNMNFETLFIKFTLQTIKGRYLPIASIEPFLKSLPEWFSLQKIGVSVESRPIYKLEIGTGKVKILMWSQMHGNESTTTKAVLDLLHFLKSDEVLSKEIKEHFTLTIIPILNPDGAFHYKRENANGVDLNRDAQNATQPEMQLLREQFNRFQPDYCFNLHDQRTIFGLEQKGIQPATVSFLAAAYDEDRNYNEVRLKAAEIILTMTNTLQTYIPNQIGRFDDSFNINCTGDYFQSLGVPTVLFEAGHFQKDYQREVTRKYIFMALLSGLSYIIKPSASLFNLQEYLDIPQNKIVFCDIVYKNIKIHSENTEIITNIAIQFQEVLNNGKVEFQAIILDVSSELNRFGHETFDMKGAIYQDENGNCPKISQKADFSIGNLNIKNGFLVDEVK